MEHIASIIGATASAAAEPAASNNVVPIRPRTIHDLVEVFTEGEALHNPDAVLPLSCLHMTPEETIAVPELGEFGFNAWSRRQLSSLLGLRWDRWFENSSAQERAEEINRRLSRASGEVKVRTSRAVDGQDADGTLRALVTPGYSPVEDSQVALLVMAAMRGVDGEMRIIRADMTEMSTTFVVAVGKPYKVGGPGDVGDVWGGLLVRNSGVGFASLLMVAHLVRLACRNGMSCPLPESVLLRRRHRGLDDRHLRWELADKLEQLPGRLRSAGDVLRRSAELRIENIEQAVRGVLTEGNLPLRMLGPIIDAYGREPMPTAFGVSQAITLAAQRFSPEERLQLEGAAGNYLRQAGPATS